MTTAVPRMDRDATLPLELADARAADGHEIGLPSHRAVVEDKIALREIRGLEIGRTAAQTPLTASTRGGNPAAIGGADCGPSRPPPNGTTAWWLLRLTRLSRRTCRLGAVQAGTRPLATIPPGGVRFIARGAASSPCWKATRPRQLAGLESEDPRQRSAGTTRPKHVIDEAAGCDRLLLVRDGVPLDQTTRSCCAKAPASTIWPRLPCRIAVIEAAAR